MSKPESSKSTPEELDPHSEAVPLPADIDSTETAKPNEFGGPKGLEPTRYGDWEQKGRCIDF